MIRPAWWLLIVSALIVLWQECGENLALFCYRIAWGVFSIMRSRALAPIPISQRTHAACLNSSATCSTPSTMSKE
jgi:hypothetical protein